MARTRAFKENALVRDLFDYPLTDVIDPYATFVTRVDINGAGDTTYNGVYTSIGFVGPDSTIVFKKFGTVRYVFYNESEWRLGLEYSPPDEDFAYYVNGLNPFSQNLWGPWTANTAANPAPTSFVGGLGHLGRKGGFGFGSNAWTVDTTCFDAGVKDSNSYFFTDDLTYVKSGLKVKSIPKHAFSNLSVSPWPDVSLKRSIDPAVIPSRLLTSNKLGKNGTTLYMAYIVKPKSTIPAGRWFGIKHGDQRGWFGRNWNQSYWGMELSLAGGQQNSTVTITVDTVHLVVQKQVWASDGSKVLGSLWIDPVPARHPAQVDPVDTPAIDSAEMSAYTTDIVFIGLSQIAAIGSYRLGETYFAVAPGQAERV